MYENLKDVQVELRVRLVTPGGNRKEFSDISPVMPTISAPSLSALLSAQVDSVLYSMKNTLQRADEGGYDAEKGQKGS